MANVELSYNLKAACQYNGIDISDVTKILLEITGENDEYAWHWIVRTKEGFAYITGGCDYTGWDCQSSAERFDSKKLQ